MKLKSSIDSLNQKYKFVATEPYFMRYTLVFLFVYTYCSGQLDTLYLDKEEQFTTITDSIQYKRVIISHHRDGSYKVIDYLKDNSKYFEGSVAFLNSRYISGDYTKYYNNGRQKLIGEASGLSFKTYHQTGKLMAEYKIKQNRLSLTHPWDQHLILAAYDSLGNPLLFNGSGVVSTFYPEDNDLIWSGSVKKNKMDGAWIAVNKLSGEKQKVEYFDNGNWVKGVLFTHENTVEYVNEFESKGIDIEKFSMRIKETIREQLPNLKDSNKEYHFGLVFKNGRAAKVIQLLQSVDEKIFDLSKVSIPDASVKEKGEFIKYFVLCNFRIAL